jgi:hypothetical protein
MTDVWKATDVCAAIIEELKMKFTQPLIKGLGSF